MPGRATVWGPAFMSKVRSLISSRDGGREVRISAKAFVPDPQIVRRAAGHRVTSLNPRIQCGVNGRRPPPAGQPGHVNALVGVVVLYIVQGDDERFEEKAERAVEIIEHRLVRIER